MSEGRLIHNRFSHLLGTTTHLSVEARVEYGSCQNMFEALTYLLVNIFSRFGTTLYRQIVGIPMGTNCAPLMAELFIILL